MSLSRMVRLGSVCLACGGAVWLLLGIGAFSGVLGAIPGREDVVLFVIALLLTALGLLGVHAAQEGRTGVLGRLGLSVALLAIAVRAAGGVAYLAGSLALEGVSLPATVGMGLGLLLYGVATLRAGVLPRAFGAALALAMPLSIPLEAYGTALFGLILTALGVVFVLLARGRGAGSARPRVR